jgi:1-pyrroline-5-carboxylate dehydrogenase
MPNSKYSLPLPPNEPVKTYAPGTSERSALKKQLSELKSTQIDIPLIIGGKEVRTGKTGTCILPHDHQTVIGTFHQAGEKEVHMAIEAALEARKSWATMAWENRVSVFLKAAELLAGPRRYEINAATMLCQSKNAFQAEIDSACELIDFLRFNSYYAMLIFEQQPPHSPAGTWNGMEYRPLEGHTAS